MKSALIHTNDRSCAVQCRRSSGNTSIERERHDEIGSHSRTGPERVGSRTPDMVGHDSTNLRSDDPAVAYPARTDRTACYAISDRVQPRPAQFVKPPPLGHDSSITTREDLAPHAPERCRLCPPSKLVGHFASNYVYT